MVSRQPRPSARAVAPLLAVGVLLAACGASSQARLDSQHGSRTLVSNALPPFDPASPTAGPSPASQSGSGASAYSGGGGGGGSRPPSYPLVGHFDAPSIGVHIPVVAVGIVRGAMDAPEGPLGSAFWREGFWLRYGAVPGNPGVATLAGHLDDTAGRPAAFWNVRNIKVGATYTFTRQSDGAVLTYKIVETDVWTLATADSKANLQRIYGPGTDGLSRMTLITCTGHWTGTEYDHRFVAFAVLQS